MDNQFADEDPLLYEFPLPLHGRFYFLGFPIELFSNSPLVLAAAEESWGMFRSIYTDPPLEIRIGVLPGERRELPPRPTCRGYRNLITQIADAENYAVLDTRQGLAFGWLTQAATSNSAYLRYHFLEGTAWILLESLYLTSVHGACVELDGHGVLLCGESGAGKSSLAYACALRGWKYLSDDATCLIRNRPGRAVAGNCYQMRFRESARSLFPELTDQPSTRRATGEQAIEMLTATRPDIVPIFESRVDYIVFLNRFDGLPQGLTPFPEPRALQWLSQVVCFGEPAVRQTHLADIQRLAGADIVEMRYRDTDTAIDMLEALVRNSNFSKPMLRAARASQHE